MVVEVIDAPWAGVPARIRWFKRRWICREHACQTVTFLEHDERVCAPRARLGARAIRWAIRQLRFEGATISGLARQLGTTWNTVWSHIKPCLQAAFENPARFAVIRVLVRDVFHEDTPAQGRRLATCLVARLPMCPIPAIARLGRTLCNWKDLLDAYFDIGALPS